MFVFTVAMTINYMKAGRSPYIERQFRRWRSALHVPTEMQLACIEKINQGLVVFSGDAPAPASRIISRGRSSGYGGEDVKTGIRIIYDAVS